MGVGNFVVVGGHAANALHEFGDHGLAEVGIGLLVADADPRALAAVGNLEEFLLLASSLFMRLVSADFECNDAL